MSENGKHRMYADFSEDAYNEYLEGNAELNNNGFRSTKGYFMPEQPVFSEIEKDKSDSETEEGLSDFLSFALVSAISVSLTLLATKVAPDVKGWWKDKVYPSILSKWRKIKRREENKKDTLDENNTHTDIYEMAVQSKMTVDDFIKLIEEEVKNYKANLSSSEAQEHIIAIMGAAAFIASELRKLSNVCIKDDNDFLELRNALEKLATQEIINDINLLLEKNVNTMGEDTSKFFLEYFGGGGYVDRKYIPLQRNKVKEALNFYEA